MNLATYVFFGVLFVISIIILYRENPGRRDQVKK